MPPDMSGVVLVVDDDPSIHRLLGRILRLHGFRPMHAESLSEAIGIAERHTVRGVILDLALRGEQSGLDVLRWFRSRGRQASVPVLVLTGAPELTEDQAAAIEHHHAEVFFKPQRLHLLIDRLKAVLADRPM